MNLPFQVVIRPARNNDRQIIMELIIKVLSEYDLQFDPQGVDRDLSDIEKNYFRKGGLLEIMETPEGAIIGCVGLYPLQNGICELRKMYLLPEFRGRGLGKFLLERMLRKGRQLGFHKMVLETASVLKRAVALYEKYGFKPVDAGQCHSRCDRMFELDL